MLATKLKGIFGYSLAVGLAAALFSVSLPAPVIAAPAWDKTPARIYTIANLLTTSVSCVTVKSAPGALRSVSAYNTGAAVFVQFYNAASDSAVTLASGSPTFVVPVASADPTVGGAVANLVYTDPLTFSTGICVSAVTAWTGATTASVALSLTYY